MSLMDTESIPFSAISLSAASSRRMRVSRLRRAPRGWRPSVASAGAGNFCVRCQVAREFGVSGISAPSFCICHIVELCVIVDNIINYGSNVTVANGSANAWTDELSCDGTRTGCCSAEDESSTAVQIHQRRARGEDLIYARSIAVSWECAACDDEV